MWTIYFAVWFFCFGVLLLAYYCGCLAGFFVEFSYLGFLIVCVYLWLTCFVGFGDAEAVRLCYAGYCFWIVGVLLFSYFLLFGV